MVVPFIENEYDNILKNKNITNEEKVYKYNELSLKKNLNSSNSNLDMKIDKSKRVIETPEYFENEDNNNIVMDNNDINKDNIDRVINKIKEKNTRNSSFYYQPFENTRVKRKKRQNLKKLERKLIFDETRNINENDNSLLFEDSIEKQNRDKINSKIVNKEINTIWQHLENNENITKRQKDWSKIDKKKFKNLINTIVKTEKKRKLINNLKNNKKRKIEDTDMMEISQLS